MQNFTQFWKRLKKWREIRHLSHEQQIKGYSANLLEEMSEFSRAVNNNDENEIIDAVCDIMIFTINLGILDEKYCILFDNAVKEKIIISDINKIKMYQTFISKSLFISNIAFHMSITGNTDYNLETHFLDFMHNCIDTIKQTGYDVYQVMDETLKEIESRTGKWDESIKKFVKDEKISPYKAVYKKLNKGD